MLGGICTIVFGLTVGTVFLVNLFAHLNDPVFDQRRTNSYLSYDHNEVHFNLPTSDQTIAGALDGDTEEIN